MLHLNQILITGNNSKLCPPEMIILHVPEKQEMITNCVLLKVAMFPDCSPVKLFISKLLYSVEGTKTHHIWQIFRPRLGPFKIQFKDTYILFVFYRVTGTGQGQKLMEANNYFQHTKSENSFEFKNKSELNYPVVAATWSLRI